MVRAGGRTKPRIAYNKDSDDGGDSSDDNRESPAPPPPKKRKPPMKPPAKKPPPPKDESSDDGMESEEDERPVAKKVTRAPPKTVYKDEGSDEDGNESDYVVKKSPQKAPPKKETPKKKAEKPPSKVIYKDVESSDDFQDDGEVDNGDSDFEEPKKKQPASRAPAKKRGAKPKVVEVSSEDNDDDKPPPKKRTPNKGAMKAPQKKTPAKKSPAKKAAPASSRASGRGAAKPIKYTYDSDDEEEENSVEEVSSDEAPAPARGKKKMAKQPAGRGKPPPPKKVELPPMSEMIPAAIRKLRDNSRKGSSLAAIKGIIAEEWGVDIKAQAPRIKKVILGAVERKEIIQTKGKGASGRFTVPGLKIKKKKPKSHLTKKWDEDQEEEYKPAKTARSEDKDKFLGEQMQRRKERMEAEARRLEEKEKMPKKIVVRKDVYEVESIKAMKTVGDKTWYNVMYEKAKKGHWEPEENLDGCREIIDNFLMEEKVRLVQEEEKRRREEEEGKYEVQRILEVKFKKGEKKQEKKEFLIRWKGHGEEMDSWEPEENLDCLDLIDKFMKKWEIRVEVEEKELRIAPTKVKRLQFSVSKRVNKRNNGFRKTYEDMDEDWD